MSESLDIVSEETGEVIGFSLPRAEALARQEWCRTTNVFVLNSKGEILCHQRSQEKERMPGVWVTHLGGHVGSGETYETNAAKELAEESGMQVHASRILPWRTTRLDVPRLWVREFVTLVDEALHTLTPQPGEVEQFAWLPAKEILRRAKQEPEMWCAGTHDFATEYACMLAAVHVAESVGLWKVPQPMHVWHPSLVMTA